MNIHPIVVHFPIALLTLYSMLEVVSLFGRSRTKQLHTTKLFLLLVGTGWAFFSLQTGELAAEAFGGEHGSKLISTHAQVANLAYGLYVGLSIYYILVLAYISGILGKLPSSVSEPIRRLIMWQAFTWLVVVAALVWLLCITITGALWGAITYGPDADPVVRFFYDLLVW